MKITNKNLIWWLLSPFIIAFICFEISILISDIKVFLIINGIILAVLLFFGIAYVAIEGVNEFEIDLSKLFRAKVILPEEQDKKNK